MTSFVDSHGLEKARTAWENHWSSWVTINDVTFLHSHGINAVRIPIGFFTLSEPDLLIGTEFEHVSEVYLNCWSQFLEPFIRLYAIHQVGVLLDMHCVSGGQNCQPHAGTDQSECKLYSHKWYQRRWLESIKRLIQKVAAFDNIIGIQAMNEAEWGHEHILTTLYKEIATYAVNNGGVPIYISDSWNISFWAQWVGDQSAFCVVDHHYYYCFAPEQHAKSIVEHTAEINESSELAHASQEARGSVIVGEWSLALHETSKDFSGKFNHTSQASLRRCRRYFALAQLNRYTRDCAGFFFWTFKFQVRNMANEWDLSDMIACGALPENLQIDAKSDLELAESNFSKLCAAKVDSHCQYWKDRGVAVHPHHYEDGFIIGWQDAMAFAKRDSRLVFVQEWTRKRLSVYLREMGHSTALWEFEHGIAAGVQALQACH